MTKSNRWSRGVVIGVSIFFSPVYGMEMPTTSQEGDDADREVCKVVGYTEPLSPAVSEYVRRKRGIRYIHECFRKESKDCQEVRNMQISQCAEWLRKVFEKFDGSSESAATMVQSIELLLMPLRECIIEDPSMLDRFFLRFVEVIKDYIGPSFEKTAFLVTLHQVLDDGISALHRTVITGGRTR